MSINWQSNRIKGDFREMESRPCNRRYTKGFGPQISIPNRNYSTLQYKCTHIKHVLKYAEYSLSFSSQMKGLSGALSVAHC